MLRRVPHFRATKRFGAKHPEWWALVLAVICWVVVGSDIAAGHGGALSVGHDHSAGAPAPVALTWASVTVGWGAMTIAMMTPSTLPDVRYVARASLRARRDRSIALFFVGFISIWLPGAVAAGFLSGGLSAQVAALPIGAFAVAAAWEFTGMKRRALLACRRTTSIRSSGWNADRSCLRFGVLRGWTCMASCGPAMLALMTLRHAIIPMLAVGIALHVRKIAVNGHRHPRATASVLLATGGAGVLG